jgi:hypothetical protein
VNDSRNRKLRNSQSANRRWGRVVPNTGPTPAWMILLRLRDVVAHAAATD